jgi:GNAT superfamily N-acetyltransferase
MDIRHTITTSGGYIVAYLEGEYMGYIKYTNNDDILIDELVVSRNYRGRGYGSRLLSELFNRVPARRYHLIAREYYDLWGRLEAFYYRNGFRTISDKSIWADGEHYREIDMEKLTIAQTSV